MNMKEQYLAKKFSDRDYNCAEMVLNLANTQYQLGLDEQTSRVAAGFGGGVGVGHLCGAVSGAIMALSLKHVDSVAHQSPIKTLTKEYLAQVEQQLGSLMCDQLKHDHYQPDIKCQKIIACCLELLEPMMI